MASCTANNNYFTVDDQLKQALDAVSQHFVDTAYISGGVSMVAHRGRIVYENAYGMQCREGRQVMRMDALFRIASMAKPVTTAALMRLIEEGRISLDDTAGQYIPALANIRVLNADGVLEIPRRPLTIRHLLSHTSGTRSRADRWFREHGIDTDGAPSLEVYVDHLLQAPLHFHPGEGFQYAMNNDICARIVEVVTGENYGDFLKTYILDPLGMHDTHFIIPDDKLDRLTSIYAYTPGGLVLIEGKKAVQSVFPRGNGQLVSTARDYMLFLEMLWNRGAFRGDRILEPSSIDAILTNHLPPNIPLRVGPTTFPETGFGLSMAVSRRASEPWTAMPIQFENVFRHLPEGSYFWPGITNTFFWVDPKNDVYGVVLSQSATPGVMGNFQAFTQTFYSNFFRTTETE